MEVSCGEEEAGLPGPHVASVSETSPRYARSRGGFLGLGALGAADPLALAVRTALQQQPCDMDGIDAGALYPWGNHNAVACAPRPRPSLPQYRPQLPVVSDRVALPAEAPLCREGPTAWGSADSLPVSKVTRKPALRLHFRSPSPPLSTLYWLSHTTPEVSRLPLPLADPVCGKNSFILMQIGKRPNGRRQRLGGPPASLPSPAL